MSKLGEFVKKASHDVYKDFREIFVDTSNVIDDKRVVGIVLIISGIVFIWTRHNPLTWMDYGQIILGLAALGVTVFSDKVANASPLIKSVENAIQGDNKE